MKRILIVDDDAGILDAVGTLLSENYEVVVTNGGHSALDALALEKFDLLLLDIMMPGLNGVDFLSELRAVGTDIPTIIMTANPDCGPLLRGTEITALIHKPFDICALEALIEKHTGGAEKAQIAV